MRAQATLRLRTLSCVSWLENLFSLTSFPTGDGDFGKAWLKRISKVRIRINEML